MHSLQGTSRVDAGRDADGTPGVIPG